MNILFMLAVVALMLAVFGEPQITGSIRLNKRRYGKGDEAELQAVMTPQQHDDWQARGLITGEWTVNEDTKGAAPQISEVDLLAAKLSETQGIERLVEETAAEFLYRVGVERSVFESQLKDANATKELLRKECDELRAKFQTLETKTGETPEGGQAPQQGAQSETKTEVQDEFAIFTGIDRRALNSLKAAGIDTRQKIVETDNATLEKLQYVTQQNIEQMRGQIAAATKPGA